MNYRIFLAVVCATFVSQLGVSHSGWCFGPKQPEAMEAPAVQNEEVLKSVFAQLTQELAQVETFLAAKQNREALKAAKSSLDRARERSGIQPQANLREKIEISGILEESDLKVTFAKLANRKRDALTSAVLQYRGGLYFTIINQMKQASLLFTRASIEVSRETGLVLQEDIQKMMTDLLAAYRIPVLLRQDGLTGDYVLFDSDVAQSDQQYFFNRELKVFALQTTELNLTETKFDDAVNKYRTDWETTHWRGFTTRAEAESMRAAAEKEQARRERSECRERERKRLSEGRSSRFHWDGPIAGTVRVFTSMLPSIRLPSKTDEEQVDDVCGG